jgi:autotransporter-associated beta strand protein
VLTITGGIVNTSASGQISDTASIVLNGSSTLTLIGNNTLDSITFNHVGGTGAPTVTTGGVLTLTNANAITVTTNNAIGLPAINGFLDIGSGAKIFEIGAIQMNGVVYDDSVNRSLNIGAIISGEGSITKTGDGLLGLSGQSTFTGGLTISAGGLVLATSSTSTVPNGLVSGPLGLGSVTMAAGTKLLVDDSSRTVANAITFEGNPILSNTGGSTDTMTLNGAITFGNLGTTGTVIGVESPYLNVSLAGRITGLSSVTSIGSGSGANTLTKVGPGNITVLNITGISDTATIDITSLTNTSFTLLHDGDGTSSVETIQLGAVTWEPVNGVLTLIIGRAGTGTHYPTPAFKTLSIASFTSSVLGNGITLTNNNLFGLVISTDITLSGSNSFSVSTASTSLQPIGLTLDGILSGSGLTKAGNGVLKLGNASNNFTGTVSINDGTVEAATDGALGNLANLIQISSNSLAEGLRISGTFATDRTIRLNAASSGIDVTGSNTFTLNTAFTFATATNAFRKNDRGTLVLTQAQAGWDGILTIGQGVLRISDGASLGTTVGHVIIGNVGASLELDGSGGDVTVNDAIQIASTNNSSSNGINSSGAIHSLSGTNTLNGTITIDTTTTDSNSRSGMVVTDAGSTLIITAGIVLGVGTTGSNRDNWIAFSGEGTTNITTTGITHTGNLANGFAVLTKLGSGTLNLQVANAFSGQRVVVKSGILSLNGNGTLGVPGTGGGTGDVYLNPRACSPWTTPTPT